MLADYPSMLLVNFFISGIQEEFGVGYTPCTAKIKSAKRNLQCALEHPEVVESYLADEVALGCVFGSIFLLFSSSRPHQQVWGHPQESSVK